MIRFLTSHDTTKMEIMKQHKTRHTTSHQKNNTKVISFEVSALLKSKANWRIQPNRGTEQLSHNVCEWLPLIEDTVGLVGEF